MSIEPEEYCATFKAVPSTSDFQTGRGLIMEPLTIKPQVKSGGYRRSSLPIQTESLDAHSQNCGWWHY